MGARLAPLLPLAHSGNEHAPRLPELSAIIRIENRIYR
jgi:hypothetical protein